jgi:hypothetical protein
VAYFSENNKVSIAITTTAGAAGSTAVNGAVLDTAGFEGGCAVVAFGAIVSGAATSIKLQQSADATGDPDDFSDVLGTGQTVADNADDKVFYCDFRHATKRYVRVVVSRATQNATVGSALYVQYGARSRPVTQGTNVAGEQFTAAAEGTA